jgi:imidazolonepropionase
MSLVITGANIMPMGGQPVLRDAAIYVEKDVISFVGPETDLPSDIDPEETYEADGAWLTPGLIDCHTHLVWGGSRADEFERKLAGESYESIAKSGGGILSTVRSTRETSLDDLVTFAKPRFEHLIDEGVTRIDIKSGYGLDLDSELKMLQAARSLMEGRGMPLHLGFLGAHALPPEFSSKAEYIRYLSDEVLPAAHRAGLVTYVDAFVESIAFSGSDLQPLVTRAKEFGLPIRLHADQLSDSGGAELAAQLGALSADHVEYTNPAGVRAMAGAGTVAVLLPGAFYNLRMTQLPPIELFRSEGVPMAVATDCNPGSSPMHSLLLAMNMACVLMGLTVTEALEGVTTHAAQALGVGHKAGKIQEGFSADLALWEVDHPRDLVYQIGRSPLLMSWTQGKPLFHDLGFDLSLFS